MNKKVYSDEKELNFFAAANTYDGFLSFFSEIFDTEELQKLVVLKGGPGVGKSTLMKNIAKKARESGLTPVCYHCSSDPFSLDGVLVKEKSFAVIDGTAPHTFEPKYAGAKGKILNLGEAWNTSVLEREKAKITSLSSEKDDCFRRAYALFAAAENVIKDEMSISEKCIDKEKAYRACDKFSSKHFKNGSFHTKVRHVITNALGKEGRVRFFTPENESENKYFVKDVKKTSHFFFSLLYENALGRVDEMYVGCDELNPQRINCLYFPSLSLCVSLHDDEYCLELEKQSKDYKIINLGRFFDLVSYRKSRSKYRFAEKCEKSLMKEAFSELNSAGILHAKLEEIYGEATDYEKITLYSEKLMKELFI
ncbi:MAG: hypothetical protein J6036_02545 [Clostridia bacterium]|nr:hypothetical protein [Clostridia bacterium]